MSLPAVAAVLPAVATNPLDIVMASINTNPYFIGIMMLLLNLGGRFLSLEISKGQEKFLSQPFVRRFFLFAVIFVATRNIIIAFGLSIIIILFLGYLFNENSELCLWNSCNIKPGEKKVETFVGLTPEEAMILNRLKDKQRAAQETPDEEKSQESPGVSPISQLYKSALNQINNAATR